MVKIPELKVEAISAMLRKTAEELKDMPYTREGLFAHLACIVTEAYTIGDEKAEKEATDVLRYYAKRGSEEDKRLVSKYLKTEKTEN
ncbi:MAG: hypothetical protein V1801_03010 [Candidatus Falkowbacteria bacterium]